MFHLVDSGAGWLHWVEDPSIVDPYLSSLPDGGWTLVSALGVPQFTMAAFTAILLIGVWHVCLLSTTRGVRAERDYLMAVCEDVEGGLA